MFSGYARGAFVLENIPNQPDRIHGFAGIQKCLGCNLCLYSSLLQMEFCLRISSSTWFIHSIQSYWKEINFDPFVGEFASFIFEPKCSITMVIL